MSVRSDGELSADHVPLDGGPFRLAALAVPADKDYLALARLTAMHVAAMLGLTVGRLTDLRLAVNEACVLLLHADLAATHDRAASVTGAADETMIELRFERHPGELRVLVTGPAPQRGSDPDEVGWLLLRALVGDVRMDMQGETATVTLTEPLPVAS
ncbi:MAG TPA: ATP-binding protein [Actinospica sp.]|nr:ATP-binding protein [Actinospica sp.]